MTFWLRNGTVVLNFFKVLRFSFRFSFSALSVCLLYANQVYLAVLKCIRPYRLFFLRQVENLTRKAQLQEVELERTTKQLKEALSFAAGEATKCNAAKEVIKSLTAQVSCVLVCDVMLVFGVVYICYYFCFLPCK